MQEGSRVFRVYRVVGTCRSVPRPYLFGDLSFQVQAFWLNTLAIGFRVLGLGFRVSGYPPRTAAGEPS